MTLRLGRFAALVLAMASFSAPAFSAGGESEGPTSATSTLDVAWNLYIGGVPLGTAAIAARIDRHTYKASSRLETSGVANRFWQTKLETASHGKIEVGRVLPERYDSFQTRRNGRRREVTINFDANGPTGMVADPPYNDDDDPPITEEDKLHSRDPLSSLFFLITSVEANDDKPCGVVAPVYDGRRRYDVGFRYVRQQNVRMDNGVYAGPALVCEIEYREVAGYDQDVYDDDDDPIPRIYAWVATVASTASPGRRYLVPFRLWTESERYGLITAVASQVRIDGTDAGRGN